MPNNFTRRREESQTGKEKSKAPIAPPTLAQSAPSLGNARKLPQFTAAALPLPGFRGEEWLAAVAGPFTIED